MKQNLKPKNDTEEVSVPKSLEVHVQSIYFWNDIKQTLSKCNSNYDTILD